MTPVIHVYIAGGTAAANRVLRTVQQMVDQHLSGNADVRVIDVLEDPQAAEDGDVLVTPTVDCLAPLPRRRTVGMPTSAASLAAGLMLDDHRIQDPQ